jgi:hypothetical protein
MKEVFREFLKNPGFTLKCGIIFLEISLPVSPAHFIITLYFVDL